METIEVKMMVAEKGTREWHETTLPVQVAEHASTAEITCYFPRRRSRDEAELTGPRATAPL